MRCNEPGDAGQMPRPWLLIVDREVRGRFTTIAAAEAEEERLRFLAAKHGRVPITDVAHTDWPSCAWLKNS